jgi:hypothetical protein
MADIRKTIEVAYQADVTNLLSNLKKIPGMTDEEAKKMVKALSQQLKQTEKAAKKAAKTNSQSMRKMQNSAKKTAQEFRKMKRSASEMGRGLGELGSIFGDTDTEMGQMINNVSMMSITASALLPLFGSLKAAIVTLGASTAMATGGLTILAGGLALLVANMGGVDEETKKQKEAIAKLDDQYKQLNSEIERVILKNADFRRSLEQTLAGIRDLEQGFIEQELELQFKLGKISQKEYEQFLAESKIEAGNERIKASFDEREKALKESIRNEETALKQLQTIAENVATKLTMVDYAALGGASVVSDMEKIRRSYKNLVIAGEDREQLEKRITDIIGNRPKEYVTEIARIEEQRHLVKQQQAELNKFNQERFDNEKRLQDRVANTVAMQETVTKNEKRKEAGQAAKAAADKNEAENQARLNKLIQQRTQLDTIELGLQKNKATEIEKININIDQQVEKLKSLQSENDKIAQTESERINTTAAIAALEQQRLDKIAEVNKKIEEQINLNLQAADKAIIEGVISGYENQKISLQDLYSLEDQLRNDKAEKEGALHKQVMSMISAEEQARLNMGKTLLGDVSKFTQARLTMIQNTEDAEQKAITKAFYLNQAASAAGVAFATAENITKAIGMSITNPVLGAALVATAVASGAAQMGAIMSQPPPQKKHMGGMATDERNYTLLRGEAVLSRQATRRLGEEGVRNLNAGGTPSNQVVVVSPFKHYDRFISSRNRRTITTRTGQGGF